MSERQPAPGAAFFDVDRTLIAGASALRLAKPFRRSGLLSRRQELRAALTHVVFRHRGSDASQLEHFVQLSRTLMSGWDHATLQRVVEQELTRHVHPTVYREALERIDLHRRMGQPVYAVSATIRDVVEPLARLLELDGAIATDFEVRDGRFTGEVLRACHGEGKAEMLREFAEREGIDLEHSWAYSDSITDEPFLRAVGRPFAVNPDKALRALAEKEGWGILSFRTPVSAPWHAHRVARLSAAGVLAGSLLLLRRRRRRA